MQSGIRTDSNFCLISLLILTVVLILAGCGGKSANSIGQFDPRKTPPKVPYDMQSKSDCLACHGTGANGTPKIKHSTSNNCLTCHRPG